MENYTPGNAWRCVRESMSLLGQTSPFVDHANRYVDGSFVNNLPVSVDRDMGANIIIAVDIASAQPNAIDQDRQQSTRYNINSPSKWYAHVDLFKSFNIPNMDQLQQRLASVLGVTRFHEAKTTDGGLVHKAS